MIGVIILPEKIPCPKQKDNLIPGEEYTTITELELSADSNIGDMAIFVYAPQMPIKDKSKRGITMKEFLKRGGKKLKHKTLKREP